MPYEALAGMGAGGSIGGLMGNLYGIGVPDTTVGEYERDIEEGKILAPVHCDRKEKTARAEGAGMD